MSINITDAESSFLQGRAEFNNWVMEFTTRWYLPQALLLIAAAVKDAGTQGMLDNPEAIIKTDQLVKRMTGRE
jgi:hypothetical protein